MAVKRACWTGQCVCLFFQILPHLWLLPGRCQEPQAPTALPGFLFTSPLYNATVYENSAARTYVSSEVRMGVTLVARSWQIKYTIVSGDEEGLFEAEDYVLGDFCFLRIRTKGGSGATLNREVRDSHSLSVIAIELGGWETWTMVSVRVLDTNDLRPLFAPTTYSVTVAESSPLGDSVAQVSATDADVGPNGELYYFFKDKVDLFAVHPTSGVIYLTVRPDAEQQGSHDLEVLAVDRGAKLYGDDRASSAARLFVRVERVNEYVPSLSVVTRVPSALDKDPVLAVVTVEDLDEGPNGDIEWVSIVGGDPLEQFTLDPSALGNEYKIKMSEAIDWDRFPYACNLTLQAKDRGSPAKYSDLVVVQLSVERPQLVVTKFEKEWYEIKLSEASPPGSVVEIVKVYPEQSGARYMLSPNVDSMYFKINTLTGVITTTRFLAGTGQEAFELEVVEVESTLRAKIGVTIEDSNDNAPVFTQASYEASIDENSPVGTVVLTVSAADDDKGENACVTYSLPSVQPLPFGIDQSTGVLRTTKELDFESSPEIYQFVVRASDWGSPYRREMEVNVTVLLLNTNDNQPMFEKIACRGPVSRDFPVGQAIITISAIDVDELDPVRYKIISGNEQDYFNLNPDSGVLSLRRSLVTAGPKNGVVALKIVASDGENLSESIFVNVSVARGRIPSKNINCKETRVAQMLVEKLVKKRIADNRPKPEEGFADLFSVNRLTPQFESLPSDILVREDLAVGESVFRVKAYDGDTGFNGKILFAISDGNTDSCFSMDMESGLITVFLPMDREKTDKYLLNITIYDMGVPQRSTWRLLTLNLEDANDNDPQFAQETYNAVVRENTGIGTEVIQVQAVDRDLGKNGEVYYTLLTSTAQFGVDRESGSVHVAGQLDREYISSFNLKIEARDKAEAGSQRFSVTTLRISLEDVNDCPPAFVPESYNARVPEDLPVGSVIAWLETQDPDLGPGGQVRYSLADDYDGKFEVHRDSGVVRLAGELDFEKRQFYNLTVLADDRGRPTPLRSVSFVELEVVDVNENLCTPYFANFALRGSVKENSRVGTSVLRVIARDDDKGRDGAVSFSIRAGSGLGQFSIDEETGIIYTRDTLDCETKDSYWLTVYATDQGVVPLYATVEVYIQVEDVNDNSPLTSDPIYHPFIMENSPKDLSVIQIQAQDPDATSAAEQLTFRISSGNPQNFFTINPKTGLITTTSRKLDREQQDEHFLEVTVSDRGSTPRQSSVWVMVHILDENDNAPLFPEKLYQIKIPERGRNKRGDPIYRVFARDKDSGPNANLSYSIVSGNDDNKFFIDPQTAMVSSRKMVTAGAFDVLTIRATDGGTPPLWSTAQLFIEWIRKPVPSPLPLTFNEPDYNFTVPESSWVGEVVGVVSMQQSATPLWFDITGDKAASEMFHILQTACSMNCSAEEGNYNSQFDIEKGVGTIVVAMPLDAEAKAVYEMTVSVTDGTNTASTQVLITVLDSNDNTPIFSQPVYDIAVSEDLPADTEVFRVLARDRDRRSKLSYSIHSSVDPASMRQFRMVPGTGTLYTADRLDHESRSQHILTIMVKDQEPPYRRDLARIWVTVEDANDHAPYFTRTLYEGSVFESAAVGAAVLQVTALDRDKGKNGELMYLIEAGNTRSTFWMDPVLGIISVGRELDLSSVGQYVLTVRATDSGSPPMGAVATVRIAVVLSDNSSPKFLQTEYQAEVGENVAIGTFVAAVSAVSRMPVTYNIKGGNPQGMFKMNQFTGVITTRRYLDYESVTSYVLLVQAYNMAGLAADATVNIQVIDENDNPPVFQQLQYVGNISEAAPVNSVVLSTVDGTPLVLKALDADRNQNALLIYQIVEDTAKAFFSIDSGTGSIRTIANLDHETCSGFNFRVRVRDSGRPQLTADGLAEVTVLVVNVNDSPPKFSQETYETVLLLPTCVGAEVLRVLATDPDFRDPAGLTYMLTESSLEYFAMDSETGVLTVKSSNFSKDRYRFNVQVSDGKFSSTALATVLVREAMDADLLFSQPLYSSSVLENSVDVTIVAVVNAVGNRLNEPLKYSLLNAGPWFMIKTTSGVIQTTGVPFDREEQEVYELVVEASREQDRLRVARATLKVQVEDANDNPPVFVGLPYYAAVRVEAELGSPIFRVTATDRDKGLNGLVSYYLREDHVHFEVARLTGEFSLKKAFDVDLSNVEYRVVVFAKDGGDPPLLTAVEFPIMVVNKAMPVFEKSFYGISVNEDVAVRTPILGINAASPAGDKVIYTIVEGDPSSQFSVGFDTGVISVIYPLDYETNPYFRLTVRATDTLSGARTEVDVDITVLDVNDNAPEFGRSFYKTTLSEASMIGTPALQVVATDRDSEKNNLVRYQILSEVYRSTDHFHIDSSSGLIFTARLLDYETIQQYNFIVKAIDNGFPSLSSEIVVTITVNDTNDNPPIFNQLLYEAHVSELAPKRHLVTCVQASDADRSDMDRLRYSILSGDDRSNFVMDVAMGTVSLSSQRKQGMQSLYILNVSVSDGIFTSTAQVQITVLEANLYSPVFSQRFYLAQVRENAPVGSKLIRLRATDEDSGIYGQLLYTFIDDLGKDQFTIDVNGQILTAGRLDREDPANKDIVLTVMALDGGGRASFCSVRVMLLDENDNAPRFKAMEYRATVKSNVAKGYPVIQIQAYDPDDGTNGKVTYSLYSEARVPVVDILEIEPDNGWIITKGGFSHLKDSVLSFFVKAADGGFPAKHSLVSVYVHVLSPEDPVPSFRQPQYSFTIPEDTPVGTALGSVNVVSGLPAKFNVISGDTGDSNRGGVFTVDKETGIIKLVKPLDHEVIEAFRFKVSATIKPAQIESVSVVDVEVKVLDLNDNAPSFESGSYEAMVMEGMPIGTRVIQVRALDPDWGSNGQVTYSLSYPPNVGLDETPDTFAIDSKTGWVTTLRELDYETRPSYTFTVVAADLGETVSLSSTAVVSVAVADVNDNAPEFEKNFYRGAVREGDPLGEVVAVLSTRDGDSSNINCRVTFHITGGNSRGAFGLGLVQGEWKMYVRLPLDREEQDLYLINVTATDGLFATQTMVEVTVMDVNDNNPVCDQPLYSASVPEDFPSNRVILTVSATDMDLGTSSEIQYSLFGIGVEDFYMDAGTGELKTASSIDRERISKYKLIAQATDGGGLFCRSKISLVVLDVNDNPPVFSAKRYTANIYENAAPKVFLTRLQAYDPDEGVNRQIVYSLVDSVEGVFSIDESTGIVVLEKALDRELQSSYSLTVRATDRSMGGSLSTVAGLDITVLDVNDNPPVFQRRDYMATVPEDVTVGTELLRIYATSADIGTNAEVYYTFRSGNELEMFQINVLTGAISVSQALDYEVCKDYFLVVEAWDGGIPPLSAITTVTITVTDVNDNPPQFRRELYSTVVREDANIGQSVIKLQAEDLDSQANGQVTYYIVNGDNRKQFSIDPSSGLIKVNKKLDREVVSRYSLSVKALDSGSPVMSSTATVNIDISDVNDNPPLFTPPNQTAVIQFNQPLGSSVLQLSVTDQDSSLNGPPYEFRIISGNEDDAFTLNQDGLLRTNRFFGKEARREYTVQVQVKDSGKPRLTSTSFVSVRLTGESLYKPEAIPLEIYIITVEDRFPGGVIGRICATDRDEDDVLSFSHKFQQRTLFKVNRQDGRVVALAGLAAGRYLLNVTVSDGRYSITVGVTVLVRQASPAMLRNAVVARFEGVAPEDFVRLHLRDFKGALLGLLATLGRDRIHLLSLQPAPGPTQRLDVLLAAEAEGGGFYKAARLAQMMSTARGQLEGALRISSVLDQGCPRLQCGEQWCNQTLVLDSGALETYSTPKVSFVSPRFSCICIGPEDASCPSLSEQCKAQPCPADMQCADTSGEGAPYVCQCPPVQLADCASQTTISLTGNSYIKYRVSDRTRSSGFKLDLRVRTLQNRGIVMFTRGDPCTILRIEEGRLWFQWSCDSSSEGLGVSGRPINDGNWHAVSLELSQNFTVLTLDNSYVERRLRQSTPAQPWPLAADGSVFFGAQVLPPDLSERRGPQTVDGFQGCLDSVVLNGREMPLQNKRSRYAEVVGLTELKLGCTLYPDPCSTGLCQNGGSCARLPSGDFQCSCLSKYTGGRCETEITACAPNPCQNGGVCQPRGNTFSCACQRGFASLMCEGDINECDSDQCENGGECVNTFGSFYCNCSEGFEGQYCGARVTVAPDMQAEALPYVGRDELIGIAVLLSVTLVLLAVLIALRRRFSRKDRPRRDGGAGPIPLHNSDWILSKAAQADPSDPGAPYLGPDGPPRVLVRPTAYSVPRFQSESLGDLDKVEDGLGLAREHWGPPPESPHFLPARRGVAVCSVAPNPPPVWPSDQSARPGLPKREHRKFRLWSGPGESERVELVDLVEEVTCFSDRNSEIQSLHSYLTESCDDNASMVTVIQLPNNPVSLAQNQVYRWDTLERTPTSHQPELEGVPGYEAGGVLSTRPEDTSWELEGVPGYEAGGVLLAHPEDAAWVLETDTDVDSEVDIDGYDSPYPEDCFLCQDPVPSCPEVGQEHSHYDTPTASRTSRTTTTEATLRSNSHPLGFRGGGVQDRRVGALGSFSESGSRRIREVLLPARWSLNNCSSSSSSSSLSGAEVPAGNFQSVGDFHSEGPRCKKEQ